MELLPHWLGTVRPWCGRTTLTIPGLRIRVELGKLAALGPENGRRNDIPAVGVPERTLLFPSTNNGF